VIDPAAKPPPEQSGPRKTSADREEQSPGAVATTARHTVVDGDTLGAIAHRHLGDPARQLEIFEHNRDVLASPELLPIGKELRIPLASGGTNTASASLSETRPREDGESSRLVAVVPAPVRQVPHGSAPLASAAPAANVTTYVVQPHDTLPLIARKLFGDISRQGELIAANRQQLRTPQDLRPGMKLVVPASNARAR
jgi:nucleoid-associated protein YgaU